MKEKPAWILRALGFDSERPELDDDPPREARPREAAATPSDPATPKEVKPPTPPQLRR